MESEEEEDSAVAFKKAGSEASEPDVAKFKVFITPRLTDRTDCFKSFFINFVSHMSHDRRL